MNGFNKKELAASLCCPAMSILWAVIRFLADLTGGSKFPGGGSVHIISCGSAFLIGGILPIILTLKLKIHTEEYLKERLIVIAVIYVATGFIGLIGIPIVMFVLYMLAYVGGIVYQVLEVQTHKTSGIERAVLIISDPLVYWMIYWFLFYFFSGFELKG